jgi:hypothetical protein
MAHIVVPFEWLRRDRYVDVTTGVPARRYEHETPGALIHVDVKKLGNIPVGGGWRGAPEVGHVTLYRDAIVPALRLPTTRGEVDLICNRRAWTFLCPDGMRSLEMLADGITRGRGA